MTNKPCLELPAKIPVSLHEWHKLWLVLLLLASCLLVACGGTSEPDPTSVVGELRGSTLFFIQEFDVGTPDEQFALIADGTLWRSTYVSTPPPFLHPYRRQAIDPQAWEAADAVRHAWCAQRPTFPEPAPDTHWYVVGINCNSFDTWQVRVPADQMPPELDRLLDILPPPERGDQ
ncbi:MAG: hypothetical protein HC876_20520 [Chloroflexaceae bacterium]|nr:hypothetical protein [Chloroflexaceae bacterium]